MKLLSPREYGFKHEQWRPGQDQTIHWLLERFHERVAVIEAPPGIGKTPMAITYALNHGLGQTYICTSTKQLQRQYEAELGSIFSMKGMSNYPCLELEDIGGTCEAGPCHSGYQCPVKDKCYYYDAKDTASVSPIVVTNYSYLLHVAEHDPNFEFPKVLILDEAHSIENELLGFVGDKFSEKVFAKYGLTWSPTTDMQEAKDWLTVVAAEVAAVVSSSTEDDIKLGQLEGTMKKVNDILNHPDGKYVIEESPGAIEFKPVYAREHMHKLFQSAERIVLMSATMRPYTRMLELLGMGLDTAQVVEVPSDFDARRKPIWYYPIADVTHKNKEEAYPQLLAAIDKILDARPGVKGIIHTVSFEMAEYIKNQSRHSPRIISHHEAYGITRDEAIDEFKCSPALAARWLVSPSIEQGVDLPYDECRVNIIAKMPYGNLGSTQIRLQYNDNPVIYQMKAVHRLIQMIGRAMRAPDDWGETFVLDKQAGTIYRRRKKWFPDHIKESWQPIDSLDNASMEVQIEESR